MKMLIAVIALAGTLTGGMAEAAPIDGNNLLKACRLVVKFDDGEKLPLNQGIDVGYCIGLLGGVRSTVTTIFLDEPTSKSIYRICFPYIGISNGEAARIVVKFLENHPDNLNEDPTWLTLLALREAYPCKCREAYPCK